MRPAHPRDLRNRILGRDDDAVERRKRMLDADAPICELWGDTNNSDWKRLDDPCKCSPDQDWYYHVGDANKRRCAAWTPEEDDNIIQIMRGEQDERIRRNLRILGRDADAVQRRWRELEADPKRNPDSPVPDQLSLMTQGELQPRNFPEFSGVELTDEDLTSLFDQGESDPSGFTPVDAAPVDEPRRVNLLHPRLPPGRLVSTALATLAPRGRLASVGEQFKNSQIEEVISADEGLLAPGAGFDADGTSQRRLRAKALLEEVGWDLEQAKSFAKNPDGDILPPCILEQRFAEGEVDRRCGATSRLHRGKFSHPDEPWWPGTTWPTRSTPTSPPCTRPGTTTSTASRSASAASTSRTAPASPAPRRSPPRSAGRPRTASRTNM